MLNQQMKEIIQSSRKNGWVLEPDAKRLFSLAGMSVPRFTWARRIEEALQFAQSIGYPVVAKIISPKVIHKSEVKGVVVGIRSDTTLAETFDRLTGIEGFSGMLVEEMISGMELIVGGKIDEQFGPVVLMGMGGTGVEIYRDVVLRMAPLEQRDIDSMVRCLKARPLLEGYRGAKPINMLELERLLKTFSELMVDLQEDSESIDLNPVMCSSTRCVVADARIMLKT